MFLVFFAPFGQGGVCDSHPHRGVQCGKKALLVLCLTSRLAHVTNRCVMHPIFRASVALQAPPQSRCPQPVRPLIRPASRLRVDLSWADVHHPQSPASSAQELCKQQEMRAYEVEHVNQRTRVPESPGCKRCVPFGWDVRASAHGARGEAHSLRARLAEWATRISKQHTAHRAHVDSST